MSANETVSAVLAAELERRNMTRKALADLLGVQRSWVTNKMNGHRPWMMGDLDLVSERLGVPLAWLLMPVAGVSSAVTVPYRRLRIFVTSRYQRRFAGLSGVAA